ncbi:MAG: C25 family cysteine peptidase [Chitinophagales bacterium]|nr:C25 family cysteine peptidase [Chitinophagales bacterium]
MKRVFSLIAIFFALFQFVKAETYGNEWIDSSLTYYKFKVAEEGLHRISYETLLKGGIPEQSIIGDYVRLYRDGEEIPVYLTNNGHFSTGDFIEFFGVGNDGKMDTPLYLDSKNQPNVYVSNYTDTATYFLTFTSIGQGKRITSVENKLEKLPDKEEFFYKQSIVFRFGYFNKGENPNQLLNYVTNSEFDVGEGFTGQPTVKDRKVNFSLGTRNHLTNDDYPTRIKGLIVFENNSTAHLVDIEFGNQFITSIGGNRAGIHEFNFEFPTSKLLSPNTALSITPRIQNERVRFCWAVIDYPSFYRFPNTSKTRLAVHKTSDSYIEVTNLDDRSTEVIVYDLKNRNRYIAIKDKDILKVHFPSTLLPKDSLYMSSQDTIDITQIKTIYPVNIPMIQDNKNYIIITTKTLTKNSDGTNYVEEYKKYRESDEGGNYAVGVYYIDELDDAFASGIKGHPMAIRGFVNYLMDYQTIKPKYIFIIGKGYDYSVNRNNPEEFIQSYGNPASDNLLVGRSTQSPYPQVGVGRLSARTSNDIKIYLEKIKEYEEAQKYHGLTDQTLEKKEWMKSILHLGGGDFVDEQTTFARYLEGYRKIIEGPKFGGKVHSVYKHSTDPVQIAQSAVIDSMLLNGTSLITYFGHSSTTKVDFDLEPEDFNNPKGKYPFMFTNGCFVGNIFTTTDSYSERFVLTPDKCAIAYLAPMTYAIAYSLNQYSSNFYKRLGVENYGEPIGNILKNTAADVMKSSLDIDVVLGQQMVYHGDPAIRLNSFGKPDYIITEKSISFSPEVVNVSVDTFDLVINHKNIGMAMDTTYKIFVQRTLPNGEIETYESIVKTPYYSDTVRIPIPTNKVNGLGQNTFYIKIDADNQFDELSEQNNEVTVSRYFTIDDLFPIRPFEYSIVNHDNVKLEYSTANPLIDNRRYIVQIDTSEFFNSPLLVSDKILSDGGVIRWKPNVKMLNNTVYYWRGSLDTIYGNELSWNKSSFLYNTSLSEGWNQSHYFQFLPDIYNNMRLKEDRKFHFIESVQGIKVINGVDAVGYNDRVLFDNNGLVARNAFARSSYLFYVLDTRTMLPMSTYQVGNTGFGQYGNTISSVLTDVKIIEFDTRTSKGRAACYNFIKNIIPDQAIVVAYSFQNANYSLWAADDTVPGFNGETLFDAFESIGITDIRSVKELQPTVFFTQKGNPLFATQQIIKDQSEKIDVEFFYEGSSDRGNILSPLIGPALKWNTIDYNWQSLDNPKTDITKYSLIGYEKNGVKTRLLEDFKRNADISFIDADEYPFLQLEFNAKDSMNTTAPQLDYWRIIYDDVPEGAMSPQKHLVKTPDSIPYGGTFKAEIAFENLTNIDMDSVLVKFTVKDANNQTKEYYKRFAPLPGNDYIVIDFEYTLNQPPNQGINTIIFEANPDDNQKEKYHFNNFAIFTVKIEKDILNPIMDVTFDGRHITDGEIVSPTPEILIRLKDENVHLALNDSTLFKVFLKKPGTSTPISLDPSQNNFSFIPADENNLTQSNEAKLFYRPSFVEDGIYELRVQGADRSNNDAGKNEYRIQFKIDTRPAISNIINYPNPFSTSTQFIFTVTGTEVPTDLKIQIMTITGKVVKEITAAELGDIHIGVNRTNYKWDGRDTYGGKLANGLYLYRVTARLNGKNMDLLEGAVDKYFKKGFGKMYIVR